MIELPEEKKMLEILELAKDFEQSARGMCEMATAIAHKYQKRTSQKPELTQQKISSDRE